VVRAGQTCRHREEEPRRWRQENVQGPPAPRAAVWSARNAAGSSRRPQASAPTAAEPMPSRAHRVLQPPPRPGVGERARRAPVARGLRGSPARVRAADVTVPAVLVAAVS
jgi:hypothetical protein